VHCKKLVLLNIWVIYGGKPSQQKQRRKTAEKKAPAKKATPKAFDPTLPVFDPATIPVMAYELHSFKIHGNTLQRKRIVDLDGVGAAAMRVSEADATRLLAEGKTLAYVGEDLCMVTADMAFIERSAEENTSAEYVPKFVAFYREHIGKPIDVGAPEFKNVSGDPYGIYVDCEDSADFDEVDAAMSAKYERILKSNAEQAKNPMGEPAQLFVEHVAGRTLEAAILNFVVAAHEHDKCAKDWHDLAIDYSNCWKTKHGLAKVDHACPRYRAFTRAPWMQHKYHRGLAALARSYLSSVSERYAQASEVTFCTSARALSKKVAPHPQKLVPAKLPRLEEMDDSIPF